MPSARGPESSGPKEVGICRVVAGWGWRSRIHRIACDDDRCHLVRHDLQQHSPPAAGGVGRFAYVVGLVLAICAFGGFTFRIGERWGFGRARQTWNEKAF